MLAAVPCKGSPWTVAKKSHGPILKGYAILRVHRWKRV